MPRYVATLRAVYDAEDETAAVFIADKIRENGYADLDEDDNDVLDVTQITSNALNLTPQEVITELKRARNLLLKTRVKSCYHLAKELDIEIHKLESGEPEFAMASYQHGDFMELAESIIMKGETPDV